MAFPRPQPESTDGTPRAPSWNDVWPQFWMTAIVISTTIPIGICLGYSGVLIPQLASDLNIDGMDKGAASWIASLYVGAEILGALCGPTADYIGRKKTMIIGQIPMAASWIIMYFTTDSLYPVYFARSLSGIGAGLLSAVCYVYIAEIAHTHYRSVLSISSSIAMSFGMLLSTTIGVVLEWHDASLAFGVMSLGMLVISFALIESPYWLYSFTSRPVDETMKVLRYLNRPEWLYQEAWSQLQLNENMRRNARETNNKLSVIDHFKERATYMPFILLTILFFLQHATGIYFVIFYSANLFNVFGQDLGFGFDIDQAVMLMGIFRFVSTVLSAFMSKIWSKNRLMIISSCIMTMSSIVLIVFMSLCNVVTIDFESKTLEYSANDPLSNGSFQIKLNPLYTLTGAVALLAYVGAAGLGVMVIPWTLSSEFLCTAMRAFGNTYQSVFGCLLMFLHAKFLPYLLDLTTLPVMFSGFMVFCVIFMAFIHFWTPDTFNKEFNEIAMNFLKSPSRQ